MEDRDILDAGSKPYDKYYRPDLLRQELQSRRGEAAQHVFGDEELSAGNRPGPTTISLKSFRFPSARDKADSDEDQSARHRLFPVRPDELGLKTECTLSKGRAATEEATRQSLPAEQIKGSRG